MADVCIGPRLPPLCARSVPAEGDRLLVFLDRLCESSQTFERLADPRVGICLGRFAARELPP